MTTIDDLPNDILANILQNIEFNNINNNCKFACKKWLKIINNPYFSVEVCSSTYMNYPNIGFRKITNDEIDCCKKLLTQNEKKNIPLKIYSSSSIDHYSQHHTFSLSENKNIFWSSSGTISSDTNEVLTYGIFMNMAIISSISINFFEAYWLEGEPCFASNAIIIEITNENSKTIFKQEFTVEKNNFQQTFNLKNQVFLTKECRILLHLIGKREKQNTDSKYYVCVSNFNIYGNSGLSIPFSFENDKVIKIEKPEFTKLVDKYISLKNRIYMFAELISRIANQNDNIGCRIYLDKLGTGDID